MARRVVYECRAAAAVLPRANVSEDQGDLIAECTCANFSWSKSNTLHHTFAGTS